MIRAIVAVDENWAIGYENQLLFHISADLKRFKALTTGNVIVMGRKTLESMPKGRPLPNRINVVLSSHEQKQDVVWCKDLQQLAKVLAGYTQDIFIIGGAQMYQTLLAYCEEVYVTKILAAAQKADAYFPNLDQIPGWHLQEQSEEQEENGIRYLFATYRNHCNKKL